MNRTIVLGLVACAVLVGSSGCKLRKKSGQDYAPDYTTNSSAGSISSDNDYGNGTTTRTDTSNKAQGSLSQTYSPAGGFVKIHYPSDLVANPDSENLTFLEPQRTSSVGPSSLVTITVNPEPISQDVGEYVRVLQDARATHLTGYKLLSKTPGNCWKDQMKGVETRWQFSDGRTLQARACAFIHHKHGYSFMYAFDPTHAGDEAKLKKIVDATELVD